MSFMPVYQLRAISLRLLKFYISLMMMRRASLIILKYDERRI